MRNLLLSALLALSPLLGVAERSLIESYVVGGDDATMYSELYHDTNNYDVSNCSSLPNVPFVPLHAVGLKDKHGNPMVCGGVRNPIPKSCYVFDLGNKTWSRGPDLKRKRFGASATCLENKVCWIFGGKKKSYTEYYNPDTDSFKMGPKMPVNSAHGLCTALAPSGLIYMVAVRKPGITMAFTFNPDTREFKNITTLDVEKRYPACGVDNFADFVGAFDEEYDGSENFIVIGGGVNIHQGTDTMYIYNSHGKNWVLGPKYPHEVYGATKIGGFAGLFVTTIGGVTPTGETIPYAYSIIDSTVFDTNEEFLKWSSSYGIGRPFPIYFQVRTDYECLSEIEK